ncbi:hypothetical protein [Caballeronia eucalypticola]|uniref:hypothetical protein n=1 Tax=Caballeronia sp. 15715 TaxID=3391030 RepID=UPI0039E59397
MRYGQEFPISVDDWDGSLSLRRLQSAKGRAKSLVGIEKERASKISDAVVGPFDRLVSTMPGNASPEAISLISEMPGLNVDFRKVSVNWIRLGQLYWDKTVREKLKGVEQALGYLNIYLFQYLLYWFKDNPDTTLNFPEWPNQFLTSVFVTRISVSTEPAPCTLMEMLAHLAEKRKWKETYHYALLLQLEKFFGFLERHRDELPGCEGFSQPLWREEYPALSRSHGTNKMPVPRRLFSLFLDYFEALKTYQDRVTDLVLNGEMSNSQLERSFNNKVEALDVAELANVVGLSPVLFFREKTIRLQSIPNCMAIRPTRIKSTKFVDCQRMFLPQPHAVNQIIVALHTGLRHQHVQWLDATKFDSLVTPEEIEFTQLHVNTDKVKIHAWEPRVRMRVIEVLRSQRAWRELIDMPGFTKLRFYEDNKKTKWPKILPLFSASANGRPHSDTRYQKVWKSVLLEIQKMLPDIDEAGKHKMFKLLPPNIKCDDIELVEKRYKYGKNCHDVCLVEPATMITPHSARINVVSQYITILPADLIGKYITGQTAATVSIYVKLDEEALQLERTHQAMALRTRVSTTASLEFINSAESSSARFIAADHVNSHFSKSFRSNLAETLVSYGCISITMSSSGATGLDVLRETGGVNAAENKTEICPYGNMCPNEIVIKYKGFGRCGLCECAVRSIDHLTAVSAKVKQFGEMEMELTKKIETALVATPCPYSNDELDRLDLERVRLAEEETGWRVAENTLNIQLARIKNGQDSRRWTVQKPEMIIQDLSRVVVPSNLTSFTLERLRECVAYPTLESPQMRARFDLIRRQLLARSGNVGRALTSEVPTNVAGELAGLIRTIVQANKLSSDEVLELINTDNHLVAYSNQAPELLG